MPKLVSSAPRKYATQLIYDLVNRKAVIVYVSELYGLEQEYISDMHPQDVVQLQKELDEELRQKGKV